MKEGINFEYDGIKSIDMGISNVSIGTGMFEETFVAGREIHEITTRKRDKPYFQEVKRLPLILNLSFAFDDKYDSDKIREVARWLDKDYYKPFFTDDNPNRIFYCMLNSDSRLFHNGLKQGYVEIEMRCDSPYSYSPQYVSELYDLSSNSVSGYSTTFVNYGDVVCKPEIFITKVGSGDVSILNATNDGQEFKFTSLLNTEEIYIDCENEQIDSELPNVIPGGQPTVQYRYSNFNNNYLELLRGNNYLKIYGNCKIQFRYKFKTLQG